MFFKKWLADRVTKREEKMPDDLYQHRLNEGLRDKLMELEAKVAYHKEREDYWRKRYFANFGKRKGKNK